MNFIKLKKSLFRSQNPLIKIFHAQRGYTKKRKIYSKIYEEIVIVTRRNAVA